MRILLIRPKIGNFEGFPITPLALGYLAAIARSLNHSVQILDCELRKLRLKEVLNYIIKYKPDLIGLTAITATYPYLRKFSREIKKNFPQILIVIGGIHASFIPYLSILESHADILVIGEGEKTFAELLVALEDSRTDDRFRTVNGLLFKSFDKPLHFTDEEILQRYQEIPIFEFEKLADKEVSLLASFGLIQTPRREHIANLDEIPFPAWDLMAPNKYPNTTDMYARYPHTFILATRGCPYHCLFCSTSSFWGHKLRTRSPKNVVDEIEYLIKNFQVRNVAFWDDSLTMDMKFAFALFEEIIRRKIKILINMPHGIRTDTITKDFLILVKKAGVKTINTAIETTSKTIMRNVGKQLDLDIIDEKFRLIKKMGFNLIVAFVSGLPGETLQSLKNMIEYIRYSKIDMVFFNIARPLPGSQLFKQWLNGRNLWNYDWRTMEHINNLDSFHHAEDHLLSGSPELTGEVLKAFQKHAYRRFFLEPKRLVKTLFLRIKTLNLKEILLNIQKFRQTIMDILGTALLAKK